MAPVLRIAARTALPRWLPRLSMMTISPGLKVGARLCCDPGEKHLAIDGAVEQAGRGDRVLTQSCDEGHGLPAAEGRLANHAPAARPPAAQGRHVGFGPGLVDKDEALGIDPPLILPPLLTPALNVFAILFLCGCRFFYGSSRADAEIPRPSGGPP